MFKQVLGLEAVGDVTMETVMKTEEPIIFLRIAKNHMALVEITPNGAKLKKDLPKVSILYTGLCLPGVFLALLHHTISPHLNLAQNWLCFYSKTLKREIGPVLRNPPLKMQAKVVKINQGQLFPCIRN